MVRHGKCPGLLFSGFVGRHFIVLGLNRDSGSCCLYHLRAQHSCHHDDRQNNNKNPFQVIIFCFFLCDFLHVFLPLLFLFLLSRSFCFCFLPSHFMITFLPLLHSVPVSCYLQSSGSFRPGYGIPGPHKSPDDHHA